MRYDKLVNLMKLLETDIDKYGCVLDSCVCLG